MADTKLTLQEQIDQIVDELKNIRRSHDGITYGNGGANIRTVGLLARSAFRNSESLDIRVDDIEVDVEYLKNNIERLIEEGSVDGLEYHNNTLFLTKDGERVGDGVRIVSGSGGSGGGTSPSMTVKLTSLDDTNTFSVAEKQSAIVNFKFISLDLGEPTGRCTCNIYKNGAIRNTFKINQDTPISVNVQEYLTTGYNEIMIECADVYGNKRNVTYYITVIKLEITSNFNDSSRIDTEAFEFTYNQIGDIDKVAHFIIGEGTNIQRIETPLSRSADKVQKQVISAMSHGAHKMEVYLTAQVGDDEIESNHLCYEVIFIESGNVDPIIASYFDTKEVTQGELISIPYIVFDPESASCNITLRISYYDNAELKIKDTELLVGYTKQYWNIRNVPVGKVTFSIIYNKNEVPYVKSHSITVNKNDMTVNAVTSGLEISLSSEGRNNNESQPAVWTSNNITTTFSNFNWRTNGWLEDDSGDTCLRLNGDAQIEINFTPFASDSIFKNSGKVIEIEFAIRNVNKRDEVVIDCFDPTNNVGIQATSNKMFFKTVNQTISCDYIENKRVRVGFTVQPIDDSNERFISVYLNGVLSGVVRYLDGDTFLQSNPKTIKIGSPECGIDLYSIRTYNINLTSENMVNNYIADIADIIDKMDVYSDNDLYENGKISYRKVKAKIPTITFIGTMPTFKGDKKKKEVRMIFEHPTKPELNFDEILDQIDVQGTSSAGYVRKNWKTKHTSAHTHMEGELPAKVFCIKVDYAEATGTHNTQNANLIETFYDASGVPAIPPKNIPDGTDLIGRNLNTVDKINKVRTTITGFPVVIFHLDTQDKNLIKSLTIADLESGDYNVVFSSKGNFNYDKDAEDVFAFNQDYDVECWEFLKNEDPESFLTPWPENPLDYWEARYHPKLGDLEDLQDAGNDAAAEALGNEMISRFKIMYDWVHSTARGTYNGKPQATGEALNETYTDSLGNKFTQDTDEYRLAKFRDEFTQYFDLEYSAIYYVYTFFALMVDQRAKNMFLTYWRNNAYGPNDETNPGKWYPYFYDNDTSYGISNKGHLDFDYYHQDTDSLNGSNVYNGANSVLWSNFRDAFPTKIQSTYAKLRSEKLLTYDKVIDQFINKGSKNWSATIYNQDADYKYISVASDTVDEVVTAYPYLFQIRGNGEQHLEYFVDNRIKFCDSKWKCGDYMDDIAHTARVNIYNPTTSDDYKNCVLWNENTSDDKGDAPAYYPIYQKIKDSISVRAPGTNISILPFSRIYYAVQYGRPSGDDATKGMISKLAEDTETVLNFQHTDTTNLNDFETTIFGARDISSLGDLSNLYAKELVVSNAVKLTELTVGCQDEKYYNPNLTKLEVGNNTLLKSIDVSNCPNLTGTLDVSRCISLKNIYAKGTGLSSIALPDGGYIQELHLPNTFSNLVIKGQEYLTNSGIKLEDFKSLTQLVIDNCPEIDTLDLLQKCRKDDGNYSIAYGRLTNVNLGTVTVDFLLNELTKIKYIDENGIADNNKAIYIANSSCYIDNLTGAELAQIKEHFPYLEVKYGSLTLNIKFMNEDGTGEPLYQLTDKKFTNGSSLDGITLQCPIEDLKVVAKPTKEATVQYTFEFGGWSRNPNSDPSLGALKGIIADTTLYVAFNKTLNEYPVTFYDGEIELGTIDVKYGYAAEFPDPIKTGVSNPEIFEFIDWIPSIDCITGPLRTYAQFDVIDNTDNIREITYGELEFKVDESKNTANIIKFNYGKVIDENGNPYKIGKIANNYSINGVNYNVVGIDGFNGSANSRLPIEFIVLPTSATTISDGAFEYTNLVAINIPSNITHIAGDSYKGCPNIEEITVDKNNIKYASIEDCLIDTSTSSKNYQGTPVSGPILVTGCNNSKIPNNINVIGPNSFWGREITEITIPDNVKVIDGYSFTDCRNLSNISGCMNVIYFGAMCFYGTAISTITFPATTRFIGNLVVKNCNNLTSITLLSFPANTKIDSEAFELTDNINNKKSIEIIMNNWPKETAKEKGAPWGALNCTIRCSDGSLTYLNGELTEDV